MAALSYDTVAVLQHFAQRSGIDYPLLADPELEAIRAFELVNTTADPESPYYGYAWAGYYLLDAEGVVRARHFNEENNDRTTAANILVQELGGSGGRRQGKAKTRHLTLQWSATNPVVRPGQRLGLVVDVKVRRGLHLYAPGRHDFIPVAWPMEDRHGVEALEPRWPESESVRLSFVDEAVPVYAGRFRLVRDLRLPGGREWPQDLADAESITVTGALTYQACDDRACYPPETIPLAWEVKLEPHDRQRVPQDLRRDAASAGF